MIKSSYEVMQKRRDRHRDQCKGIERSKAFSLIHFYIVLIFESCDCVSYFLNGLVKNE